MANEQTTVTETVPGTWPGAFGLYKHSKLAMKTNIGTYLWLIVLTLLISIVINSFTPEKNADGTMSMTGSYVLLQALSLLIAVVISTATTVVELRNVGRTKISLSESFDMARPYIFPMLGLTILTGLILTISFLALIIPFFFVLPRILLAPYYLIDKQLGVIDSLKASWADTGGNVGKVWGIIGAALLMALLMITIIGIPFSLYFLFMYSASASILYFWQTRQQ
ncbi:hypothetical protein IPL85_00165 [Candidatus Saccharibacteria bacterium]|nr:MAG: hypothetical protein IPL85_00165 [Candidatus Saccharibacteria bacterium]